jgi:nucleotide-binding universal stress UspA family protein
MTPTIIVPLDGTEHALVALPVAKPLAELARATLHLIHVAPEVTPAADVLDRIGLSGAELRGAVLHTVAGDPAAGINQIASELGSSLVVMCTHTASRIDAPLGRTALAVLLGAPCPVVLISPNRGMEPWALQRVLLPHDGTPTTSAALEPATELVRSAGAELTILHVAGTRLPTERGSLTSPRYLDQPQHEWPAWVGEFLERLACACPLEALKLRMFLVQGEPADEALRFAAEHATDLIVLAWRGRWEGKVAATVKDVLHRATCPVMVIRAKA